MEAEELKSDLSVSDPQDQSEDDAEDVIDEIVTHQEVCSERKTRINENSFN